MTLTQVAALTKKIISISLAFLAATAVVFIIYSLFNQYYLSRRPVEEKPEQKFGVLPNLVFPPSNASSSSYTYSLDTETGQLPTFPKLIKVYFIPRSGVSLLAPERSKELAKKLGFENGPEVLSSTQYKFNNGENGQLTIDLTTGNFHFQRNFPTLDPTANPPNLSEQSQIISQFKSYLSSKGMMNDDLNGGRTNMLINSPPASRFKTAEVSLWPSNVDELPIVTASFISSLVKGTVTPFNSDEDKIIKVDYTYWQIDKNTYSTYPLKSATQAFEDLKAGTGYVSLQPTSKQVSLVSVYLAYYQTEDYTPYLQPVFVFQGPNFVALVPAIDQNYQKSKT